MSRLKNDSRNEKNSKFDVVSKSVINNFSKLIFTKFENRLYSR